MEGSLARLGGLLTDWRWQPRAEVGSASESESREDFFLTWEVDVGHPGPEEQVEDGNAGGQRGGSLDTGRGLGRSSNRARVQHTRLIDSGEER